MRTRNSGNPKPTPPPKKTPPSRRSAAKNQIDLTASPSVGDPNLSADDVEVTPETKATRGGKTRTSTRKTTAKTKTPPTRASSRRTPKSTATKEVNVEETPEKVEVEDHVDEESNKKDEMSQNVAEESKKEAEPEKEEVGDHREGVSSKKEEIPKSIAEESKTEVEITIENVELAEKKGSQDVLNVKELPVEEEEKTGDIEQLMATDVGKCSDKEVSAFDTKEEENANAPELEEDPEENFETDNQQQKEKNTHPDELLVTGAGKSSGHIEDALVTEEHDENIDRHQEENALDTKESLDRSFMDVDAPSKFESTSPEKLEPSMMVEDTTDTDQPLDKSGMDVGESSKIESNINQQDEKATDTREPFDQSVMVVEEPSRAEAKRKEPSMMVEGTIDSDQPLDQSEVDSEGPSKTEETILEKEEPLEEIVGPIDTEQPLDQGVMVMDIEEPLQVEEKTLRKEETIVESVTNLGEPLKTNKDTIVTEQHLVSTDVKSITQEESHELGTGINEEAVKEKLVEEKKSSVEKVGPGNDVINSEADVMEDVNQVSNENDAQVGDEPSNEERVKESGGKSVVEELKEDQEDGREHVASADAFEVERSELNAAAKERKLRKELEIFVGGLDHDATEEDLKKAFENIGGVVAVRLLKDSANKNRGYAFVKFATKELASQALQEMKTLLIRKTQCRTAPSEDNDMLFLGNICNTWTKEAVKQKLKDYGIDSVENINVVPDARHKGLSRGFAFLEFSCHADAMQAYKRLQKPDVIFGHTERTAKVAFAEPIREPDPEVMAQVKTVYLDGLPPQWTEDKVREKMIGYGEIVRITLSRNLSTAKRRDYGFVDFTTHEAAVASIEGINNENIGDGTSKRKVRARLSNPLPKAQHVKGGMCGGFKIGHGGGATSSSRSGRGGLGGNALNRQSVQHGRGFYQRGRGQSGRSGFTRDHDVHMQYPPFQRREMFERGAWRDPFVAPHDPFARGPTPVRPPPVDMRRHDIAADRGRGRHMPSSRPPFPPQEGYTGPVMRRPMDEPYFYDGRPHGTKRPFPMTEPDYVDRSRIRPRMDYSNPAVPYRAPGYRDAFVPDRNIRPQNYYGPDYRQGPPPPAFYGNERPYGRGYPPRY